MRLVTEQRKQTFHNVARVDESRMTQPCPATSGRPALQTWYPCCHTQPHTQKGSRLSVTILKLLMVFLKWGPHGFMFALGPVSLVTLIRNEVMPSALVS